MQEILQRLNLDHAIPNFEREKISTDVVCRLPAYQLESLGISNRADMMKLRTECIKYGAIMSPQVFTNCGAPKFQIPKSFLQNALENDMHISDISKLLSVSERTVYRRMSEFGLSKMTFSEIDDNNLDLKLGEIVKEFPSCGEIMLRQMLILKLIFAIFYLFQTRKHNVKKLYGSSLKDQENLDLPWNRTDCRRN